MLYSQDDVSCVYCCQVWLGQKHTWACFFFFLHSNFFFHAWLWFPPARLRPNQPPTASFLSLFLFLHVQYCTLIAFQAPLCLPVFQLQSLHALPSFVSFKLSLHLSRLYSSPSFFLLSCIKPSLKSFNSRWISLTDFFLLGRWGRTGGHARLLFPCKSCCVFTNHPFQNPNGYHQQNTRVNHTSALRLCVRLCLDISLHLKRNEEELLKKSLFALKAASLFSLYICHIFHTFLHLVQIW